MGQNSKCFRQELRMRYSNAAAWLHNVHLSAERCRYDVEYKYELSCITFWHSECGLATEHPQSKLNRDKGIANDSDSCLVVLNLINGPVDKSPQDLSTVIWV